MELKGKKIAVFLEKMFEDTEYWYPYLRMKEAGADVVAVAPKKDEYKGKNGTTAKPDKTINDIKAEDFDALIIPGGMSPDHMRREPKMVEFTRQINKNGKIVAAICHAGWMLASADIIKGKKVTSFFSIKDDLINAGAEWVDKEVVVDGNIITSRNPDDLPAFCREIISSLNK
jgi:protease I